MLKIAPCLLSPLTPNRYAAQRSQDAASATPALLPDQKPVQLSSAARHLSSGQNTGSDLDAARVQAFREAMIAGRLDIDTRRIADGLLANARELLG
ncbi:flagellar biosynthesis anti-sigma factor FlgM [Allopusillimonas ginsengisoli]|uniref:flagellar biosynthesis anti-sigma factor FlgM n=1 Tax=Allopusillimonas ginsengisoli TaxID=453575 RepID=UPI00101F7FCC|nr:flagellar biosynthesis anti-sigma factor FlgM [Allopusillimonas ginsengisoli]TEA79418.1 flagellar biosynthesis anti-sigma factor FlgM [Allopusillimonas ginsengisoli]